MLNSIEPPWYVTRMPGGVTGKACEGLPMSIIWLKSALEEKKGVLLQEEVEGFLDNSRQVKS